MRLVGLFVVVSSIMSTALGAEIIAHRGASHDAPENTLAAVGLAWGQYADAVEIDIHLTADGRIVVIHDKTTKRTAGGSDTPVGAQTFAELRRLDAGLWKSPKFAGERIPTLEEVLQTIPDGKRLFIEIKVGPEILPELARVLQASGKRPEQCPLISFSCETLTAARPLFPQHKLYWIVDLKPDDQTGRLKHTATELVERAKAARLDGLDLGKSPSLPSEFVNEIKRAGLELYVWTVNDIDAARVYHKLRIDGITTDRPELLREAFNGGR